MKIICAFLNLICLCLITLLFLSCNSNQTELSTENVVNTQTAGNPKGNENQPRIEFDEELIDFGEISQGQIVEKVFHFKNIGSSDLIISSATGSCGCTIPKFPKEPIKKGQKSSIKVIFNSNGKSGNQHKTITISTNARPSLKIIALKGIVLVPK